MYCPPRVLICQDEGSFFMRFPAGSIQFPPTPFCRGSSSCTRWSFSGAATVFWLLRFERFPEAIITQNRTFYNHSGKSFRNFSQNPREALLLFCFLSTAAQGCGGSVKGQGFSVMYERHFDCYIPVRKDISASSVWICDTT